ncbi:hypothetical protein CXB51_034815 [Gossypium anomalum]|uniref:Uncharacterized protein n=1 Tax=Gossypium anomalum TaxID=47600 RepID=A0A8J5Y2J3_9ROSI|nr:hypothetical protein CXB51_034815 [Gossypium anomalum]
MSSKEISDWTITYVRELEGIEKEKLTRMRDLNKWEPPHEAFLKINFDGAYDPQHARFGSRVVVKNPLGEILASMAVGHRAISSPFAAKAHISRLANSNSLAHQLAKEKLEKGENIYLSGGAPDFVRRKEERSRQRTLD